MKKITLGAIALFATVILAGCGQSKIAGVHKNMQEFINTFDGTEKETMDAFSKFSIDGEVRRNPVKKYGINEAKVSKFKEDQNC